MQNSFQALLSLIIPVGVSDYFKLVTVPAIIRKPLMQGPLIIAGLSVIRFKFFITSNFGYTKISQKSIINYWVLNKYPTQLNAVNLQ